MTPHECSCSDAPAFHKARNQVLKSNNPLIWLHRDGLEMSLGQVLKDVYEYIDTSLWMDANPLTYLREYFPGFEWKFYEDIDESQLNETLGHVDYIWGMFVYPHNSYSQIITAKQVLRRKEPRCFYYTCEGSQEDKAMMKKLVPNIRFVMDGFKENGISYANTKIT